MTRRSPVAPKPSEARTQLKALGRRPNKRLSQSFLEDQGVATSIIRTAHIQPGEPVLEVGPGLGILTRRLAELADQLVAVEVDPVLAQRLEALFGDASHVRIVPTDILAFAPETAFASDFVVVANLPYHITSPALRHLLAVGPPSARRMIVMVQAEVAHRIAAEPPHMTALAVITQAQARVKIARKVPRTAFYPAPAVDSAVIALDVLSPEQRAIARAEVAGFSELVHAGFKQPRKTLGNSLADGLGIPKPEAIVHLNAADIDPNERPQALALEDWVRLFRRDHPT